MKPAVSSSSSVVSYNMHPTSNEVSTLGEASYVWITIEVNRRRRTKRSRRRKWRSRRSRRRSGKTTPTNR